MFAHSGGKITQRLRSKTFHAILCQDIEFFDDAKHSTGALCTILTTDISTIQKSTSVELGTIVQSLSLFITSTITGFAYSWQLALLNCAFLPIMFLSIYGQIYITERFANQQKQVLEDVGKVRKQFSLFYICMLIKSDSSLLKPYKIFGQWFN